MILIISFQKSASILNDSDYNPGISVFMFNKS